MTREELEEVFSTDYSDIPTRNIIITNILAALERERVGGSVLSRITVSEDGYVANYLYSKYAAGQTGSLIFRPDPVASGLTEGPLVVLAVSKNSYIAFSGRNMGGNYRIDIETFGIKLGPESCFSAPTYAECEAKARQYLLGLPDAGKGESK